MAATYTAGSGTDNDRMRLLCADTDTANALLQDEEYTELLALEQNIYLAAAMALETIATSEVLILKKITLLGGDIRTDGPAVAKTLMDRAKLLRERGGAEDDGFDIVELGLDLHTREQMRTNNILKGVT